MFELVSFDQLIKILHIIRDENRSGQAGLQEFMT